jgi:hypothetical protein
LKVGSLSQDDIILMRGVETKIDQGEAQATTLQSFRQVEEQKKVAAEQKVIDDARAVEASKSSTPSEVSPTLGTQRDPTPR